MAAFPDKEAALEQANKMSDHHAQVDEHAGVVSQNLQGPYAIKIAKQGWDFDLPEPISCESPDYAALARMSGLNEAQCRDLVNFMTQQPALDKNAMNAKLQSIGVGGLLGQGGFRISIETNKAYEDRMRLQIEFLINSVDGGANVLSLQEQPYDGIDPERMPTFESVMKDLGYVSVARLRERDVGIWVKKDLAENFKTLSGQGPSAEELQQQIEAKPLRGCVLKDQNYLYINLHVDRCDMDQLVNKLIALKQQAEIYANAQNPKLSIVINGDMNLFMLKGELQKKLIDAGFVIEPVKGQENFSKPTCEAYVRAPKISPLSQSQPVSSNSSPSSNEELLDSFYDVAPSCEASDQPSFFPANSPQSSESELSPLYQYRERLKNSLTDKRSAEPTKPKHYKSSFFGIGIGCPMEDKEGAVDLVCVWLEDQDPKKPLPEFNQEQCDALKQGELARHMEAVYKKYPELKDVIYVSVSQKQQPTNG